MSQRAPKHSDPVVGRILNQAELAAQRSSAATRARIRVGMVAAVVVLALATVVFGVLADRVAVARAPVEAAAPEPARPVKRPMAAGTNEDHIARWVPVRTPSGRTELEAWTTVDAEWLKSSDTLDMVMARSSDVRAGNSLRHWPVKPLPESEKPQPPPLTPSAHANPQPQPSPPSRRIQSSVQPRRPDALSPGQPGPSGPRAGHPALRKETHCGPAFPIPRRSALMPTPDDAREPNVEPEPDLHEPRVHAALDRYWRDNVLVTIALLAGWAIAGLGCGVLFADQLNVYRVGISGLFTSGFPLGFWFAHQGSIMIFVLLILAYCLLANRLDARHHRELEELQANGGPEA